MSTLHPNFAPRMQPALPGKAQTISVLDVGTSKIACFIARIEPGSVTGSGRSPGMGLMVRGVGHHKSAGVKGGVIVDMDDAEQAIRHAVEAAERMAGVTVERVIASLAGGRLGSQQFTCEAGIGGRAIADREIDRAMSSAVGHAVQNGRTILHAVPTDFRIDGIGGIREPRGMVGERLAADMHIASCDSAPARNLTLAIERCHLEVEAMVAAPYASALSVISEDEAEMGVAVLDMGAGTTTAAVFAGGRLQHVDSIAVGGRHVTMDIARGLSMRLDEAERLKTHAAGCQPRPTDERDMIAIPQAHSDESGQPHYVPRAQLTRIVRPRIEEILELMRDRLRSAGFGRMLNQGAVLTGGAAQLTGLVEMSQGILSSHVRLGRPAALKGMPESAGNPAFATVGGLIQYPLLAALEHIEPAAGTTRATGTSGYLARMGQWLRDSF
jgi:cell division protein FtsA